MAETVGQHGIAAFVNPSNGDALDATVVKANDNTIRTAYVSHDDDGGIHVQSSLLAARPAAGTAGRKWLTTDVGSVKLWFDNGSAWQELSYVPSSGTATIDTLVVTNDLTVDTNTLRVDSTNNRVGVNITSPTVALDVVGAAKVSSGLTVSAAGITVTGNSTITGTLGGLTGLTVASGGASITGNSTITGTLGGLTGVTVTGTVTATTFSGSGASLTSLPAANLTGTLPAISGANLTTLNASNLSSGTVAVARLPTTISQATTFSAGGLALVISNQGSLRFNSSGGSAGSQIAFAFDTDYVTTGSTTPPAMTNAPAGTGWKWVKISNASGLETGWIPMAI
jgi:hypothetical protein